jgi:flagellar basal-body rod modification protein FlgD
MSSIANPLTSNPAAAAAASTTSSSSSSSAATNPGDPLANESTFLTLLVSQLQNQDPLSPTDSNQFVSQLTSYSQLEQLIGIHQNTTSLATDAGASTATTTPASSIPTSATTAPATTTSATGNQ